MAFCSATAKLFCHNLMKYNLLKITSVKDLSKAVITLVACAVVIFPVVENPVMKWYTDQQKTRITICNYAGFKRIRDSEGTRTPNQQNRNLPFYPIELRSHCKVRMTNDE